MLPTAFIYTKDIQLINLDVNNVHTLVKVGFTLSQATMALRESRGIALLYF